MWGKHMGPIIAYLFLKKVQAHLDTSLIMGHRLYTTRW